MIRIALLLYAAMLLGSTPAADLPPAAQRVIDAMESDILKAKAKAVRDLRKEQAASTRAGDLASAVQLREAADVLDEEIGKSQPAKPDPKILADKAKVLKGVWITPSGSAFTFQGSGTYTAGVVGWSPRGRWELLDATTVRLTRPDGHAVLFTLKDGATLYNQEDKQTWRKQQ